MRALRAFGFLTVFLASLAAAAAAIAPELIDWNSYRTEIETLASTKLHTKLRIEGPIALRLLPEPEFAAQNITVEDPRLSARFAAKSMYMRLSLLSLLAGQLAVEDIALRGPDMRLSWPLSPQIHLPRRPPLPGQPLHMRVTAGHLAIGGLILTEINAGFLIGGPAGGYTAEGTARAWGRPFSFALRLTDFGLDGSAGLTLNLREEGPSGLKARFSGQIATDGSLGGTLGVTGTDLSALVPAPASPFSAEGRFTMAQGLAAADNLRLKIGQTPAQGAVALRLEPALRLDLAIAAGSLDLAPWFAAMRHLQTPALPTGLDLSVEAASLAGGTLRRLRASFELDAKGLSLREASAILPGEAILSGSALARKPAAGVWKMTGQARLEAPNFRTTLAWLDPGTAAALPPGVLRRAVLAGDFTLSDGQLGITRLSGAVDDSRIQGNAQATLWPLSELSVQLELDTLALDPWLQKESWEALAKLSERGAPFPLDLRLSVGRLQVPDICLGRAEGACRSAVLPQANFGEVRLDISLRSCCVTLRSLEAGAEDAEFHLAGSLQSGMLAGAAFELNAKDASKLSKLLPQEWLRPESLWRGPARLELRAFGPLSALTTDLEADMAGARLFAHPVLDWPARRAAGAFRLTHPNASEFLRMLGWGALADVIGPGTLDAKARMQISPGNLVAEDLVIQAATVPIKGELALEVTENEPFLRGRITTGPIHLPAVSLRSETPLSFSWLEGWKAEVNIQTEALETSSGLRLHAAKAGVFLGNRRLDLRGLSAALASGTLNAEASLQAAATPPELAFAGALDGVHIEHPLLGLPIDLAQGVLSGKFRLSGHGFSLAAMLATLEGTLQANMEGGRFQGFDLAQIASAWQRKAPLEPGTKGGETPFDHMGLNASITAGVAHVDSMHFTGKDGEGTFSGSINLPDQTIDLHAVLRPSLPHPPALGLVLSGPVSGPTVLWDLTEALRGQGD
ncbi:MAG: AsmA family protein [Acidobacteriia bacterium]|nr:AsmA family protein [Methyloceanibacter sp.]MCL6492163.1 AsmA family protein [Terriglobia bacterium]